jgi:NADH dehydrogenase
VATAGLEPESIAAPVRAILRRARNVSFQLAEVRGVDFEHRLVLTDGEPLPYDYLVLAAGSVTNFFGNRSFEQHTYGLKELGDAVALRNHLLTTFEHAVRESDPERRARLLNFVVVGGGPTGVEVAGALIELIRHVMAKDYPMLDLRQARVVLLEGTERLLPALPESLQRSAMKTLKRMGVEVRLNAPMASVSADEVLLQNGERIQARTVIWAAGVKANPLGHELHMEVARGGRVLVQPTLQVPEHPNVLVLGDMAYLQDEHGQPYPMVAQVAMQQGTLAARNIRALAAGEPLKVFHYVDLGTMATIGRKAAVSYTFGIKLSGLLAWLAWLFVHLINLVGFRNRLIVLTNWAYNYFTYDRGVRLITDK